MRQQCFPAGARRRYGEDGCQVLGMKQQCFPAATRRRYGQDGCQVLGMKQLCFPAAARIRYGQELRWLSSAGNETAVLPGSYS